MAAKARALGTDGWNSFWHAFFGIAAYNYPVIIILYVIYQLYFDWNNVNLIIDLAEFFIALGVTAAFALLFTYTSRNGKARSDS